MISCRVFFFVGFLALALGQVVHEIPDLSHDEYLRSFVHEKRFSPGQQTIDSSQGTHAWCGTDEFIESSFDHRSQAYDIPTCGHTICDDPDLVVGYSASLSLNILPPIVIPYKVYYYANDDGSNPLLTVDRSAYQQYVLNTNYQTLGLLFKGKSVAINNSWWRNSWVINCRDDYLVDNTCQSSCSKFINGFDSGACTSEYTAFVNSCGPSSTIALCRTRYAWYTQYKNTLLSTCTIAKQGDGTCQPECNFKAYNWDEGDCCRTNSTADPFTACKDPASANRAWRSPTEFRDQINAPATHNLNVFIAQFSPDDTLLGFGTLPWTAAANTPQGGAMFGRSAWGNWTALDLYGITAVHEFGHVMGLYHPFHAYELAAQPSCASSCWESPGNSTLLNGDLCDDTGATPVNYQCSDPTDKDPCTGQPIVNSPYRNFMNYGDDKCLNTFTRTQKARMRCYADLAYPTLINQTLPGTIAQKPTIVSNSSGISVSWSPPVAPGIDYDETDLKYYVKKQDIATGATRVFPPTTSLSFFDSSCTNTTRCVYSVRAQNPLGNATYFSPPSNYVLPLVTPTPLPQVLIVNASITFSPSIILLLVCLIVILAFGIA